MARQGRHLSQDALKLIAVRFKALSEPTRLLLISALQDGERTVSELVRLSGADQAHVSRQLQTLTEARILQRRKSGLHVFYSIRDRTILPLCQKVLGTMEEDRRASAAETTPSPTASHPTR